VNRYQHTRARVREIDTMQAFESHHVFHNSFTGLWTTAALDDRIRSVGLPVRGERSLRRKPEAVRSAGAGRSAERDFAWSDRVVTTTSDVGTSMESGSGTFYGTFTLPRDPQRNASAKCDGTSDAVG